MDLPPTEECIVSGTLAFVLYLSQIFGLACLKFEKISNGWQIRVSKIAGLYGRVLIACTLSVSIFLIQLYNTATEKAFRQIDSHVVFAFGSYAALSAVLSSEFYFKIYRMQHVITCLAQVQKINLELNQYAVNKSNKKSQRLLLIWIFLGRFTLMSVEFGLLFYWNSTHPFRGVMLSTFVVYHMVFNMVKILNLQLSLIITHVFSSFVHLNECLKKLLQQIWRESMDRRIIESHTKSRPSHCTRISHKAINITVDSIASMSDTPAWKYSNTYDDILHRLSYTYCILNDVVQEMNKTHGVLLLLLLTDLFLNIVVNLYKSFYGILTEKPYHRTIIHFLWAIHGATDMVMLIEPCHQTNQQIKLTKHLISELMCFAPPEFTAFNSELDLFYKNLLLNKISYFPMNLVQLNRTTITMVIGTIITYLVVMIQFRV